jgi:hypothetical protein
MMATANAVRDTLRDDRPPSATEEEQRLARGDAQDVVTIGSENAIGVGSAAPGDVGSVRIDAPVDGWPEYQLYHGGAYEWGMGCEVAVANHRFYIGDGTGEIFGIDPVAGWVGMGMKFGYHNLGRAPAVGGTITQTGSKSAAVQIDYPCGNIVTHNASLAASTSVAFQVNNTKIAIDDLVILNQRSGGTSGAYLWGVERIANGSFTVVLRNVSAGPLSEALTFNFALIKGTVG